MEARRKRCVLVIGSPDDRQMWKKLFAEAAPLSDGSVLECVTGDWESVMLTSFPGPKGQRLQVQLADEGVRFVELVVIRKLCRGLDATKDDHRNKLFAMMHACVPSVNSCESVLVCLDRIPCHAQLALLRDRVGVHEFPLIDQHYYPSFRTARFVPDVPFVAKVGHAEAGYGKMVFRDNPTFTDFVGVLALHGDYLTAEPFFEKEYDIRIQKVGAHYRAYERRSSNWKTNVGSSLLEEVAVKPHWKKWADLAATTCGGLQILTVDVMHLPDGSEVIIEINDTASGFAAQNKEEDSRHVVELAIELAEQAVVKQSVFAKSPRVMQLAAIGKKGLPK
jgi:hypothetical protein